MEKFSSVLQRKIDDDDIILDASIQRFEFTQELAWKTLKLLLKEKYNLEVLYSKDTIKAAFKTNLIGYEDL